MLEVWFGREAWDELEAALVRIRSRAKRPTLGAQQMCREALSDFLKVHGEYKASAEVRKPVYRSRMTNYKEKAEPDEKK